MALTKEQRAFLDRVGAGAKADGAKSGVLASLTVAQAILESGWGTSGLAVKANALFGIKATAAWRGKVFNSDTKECYDGVNYTTINAAFRAYGSWEESIADHSDFLNVNSRYKAVIGEKDYKKACTAIKAAGYATAPDYAEKLIKLIQSYDLTKYDTGGTKMSKREDIVKVMQSWMGKKVSDGSHKAIIDIYNAEKPLPVGYTVTYTDAWCDTTVSAAAITAGISRDVFPRECGCGRHIEAFKKIGAWVENDAYVPLPGDIIFYDWQDSGIGDNVGMPDHVGIVEKCDGKNITVIEGNISNAVGRRTIAVNGKFIRGFAVPKYPDDKPVETAVKTLADAGVINSPEYWIKEAAGGKVQYLSDLLIKFADYVKRT